MAAKEYTHHIETPDTIHKPINTKTLDERITDAVADWEAGGTVDTGRVAEVVSLADGSILYVIEREA